MRTYVLRLALFCSLLLAGCGGGAPQTVATADLSQIRLQFSLGTANFVPPSENGDTNIAPYINLVESFRQSDGATGLLNSVVSLTGPSDFTVHNVYGNSGIPYDGGARNQVIDSLANIFAGGEGLGQLVNGVASAPLIGGPPAFPRTTDGNYPAGFSYGIDIDQLGGNFGQFPNGFPRGKYTLKVATPPGSSETESWTASAQLSTLTLLPAIGAPVLSFDGKGGGSISLAVPSKLTELFIGVDAEVNFCWPGATLTENTTAENGSFGLFSFYLKSPVAGPLTIAIPDNLGPPIAGGNAPTFCSAAQNLKAGFSPGTGAQATVTVLGADYPLYEMSYPQSTSQLPKIAGTSDPDGKPLPQSDITISPQSSGTAP